MDNSREFIVATISINGNLRDIKGYRNEDALVIKKDYDDVKTKRVITHINNFIRIIDKKLKIKGHFFNDDIGYYDDPPEVIKELLNCCFNKKLDCAFNLNDINRVIYFDISRLNTSNEAFNPEIKFREHFFID